VDCFLQGFLSFLIPSRKPFWDGSSEAEQRPFKPKREISKFSRPTYMETKVRKGYVPNQPIREAFLRSGLSSYDVAAFCGWLKMKRGKLGAPDTSKVERCLGLRAASGSSIFNKSMTEKNAIELIEALNLDPVDFRDIGL